MFKWPIIVLLALPNLCFFILLMPLEEILLPNTTAELLLTLSSYSYQSKFITKTLKFFTNAEISTLFRCNLLLIKCLLGVILL